MAQLVKILLFLAALTGASQALAAPDRAPLLEDGSFLTRVQGTLEPPDGGRGWSFRLQGAIDGQRDRLIELLPSSVLEDMRRRHDSLPPGRKATFELSARVTTYHGENAALPLFATPVAELSAGVTRTVLRPPGAAIDVPQADDSEDLATTNVPRTESPLEAFGIRWVPLLPQAREARERALAQRGTVRADDVERDLLDRVGDVQRSADLAPGDRQAEMERLAAQAAAGSVDPLSRRPWLDPARTVQDRHGVVARDPVTGQWRFVFESSRGEIGEREATLLPCTLLERLEHEARSTQGPLSVVLSGQVTRFEGRAYLLPTVVTPMRSGRALGR